MLQFLINNPLNELIGRKTTTVCPRKCGVYTLKTNGRYSGLIAKKCGKLKTKILD